MPVCDARDVASVSRILHEPRDCGHDLSLDLRLSGKELRPIAFGQVLEAIARSAHEPVRAPDELHRRTPDFKIAVDGYIKQKLRVDADAESAQIAL